MTERAFHISNRLVLGIVVLALGVLFTLDSFGYADAHEALRWSPAVIVAYGLVRLTGLFSRQSTGIGVLAIVVGGWLLLQSAGIVHRDFWDLWPLLLILLGIAMIRGRPVLRIGVHRVGRGAIGGAAVGDLGDRVHAEVTDRYAERAEARAERARERAERARERAERIRSYVESARGHAPGPEPRDEPAATFNVDVIMSTVARKVTSHEFTRGNVVALMAGVDVDLRSAAMAGETARLEVNLIMSEAKIYVPEDWAVEVESAPVMGTVEDRTARPADEPAGRLRVTGTIALSSLVIKN